MGILMDISKYGVEYDDPLELEYDDEVMSSGWNPSVEMAAAGSVHGGRFLGVPAELSVIEAEEFLQDVYVGME